MSGWGGGGDPCTVRSKLNKFEHVQRDGPLISGGGGADPVQRVGRGPLWGGQILYRGWAGVGPCTGLPLNRQTGGHD